MSKRTTSGLVALVALITGLFAAGASAGTVPANRTNTTPYVSDLRPVAVREPDAVPLPAGEPRAQRTLYLPAGFSVSQFAKVGTEVARALAVGPDGAVYVSIPKYGVVDTFWDATGDGFADHSEQAIGNLQCPYGLVVQDGWLYVAQSQQVTRFPLPATAPAPVEPHGHVLVNDLPEAACGPHGYRPLALDSQNEALYVAVGSSCNVCEERGAGADQRAKVWRYPLPASDAPADQVTPSPGVEVARGLRNVTAMAMNPWDGTLWGVGNERDDRGDDLVPELITQITAGADYGWPYCYRSFDGAWHPDPLVPPHDGSCEGRTDPSLAYQAHTAPLGLAFHDGRGLPPGFGPSLFVALHGSWDHSTGVGYKIIRVPLDENGQVASAPQEFALGWLNAPASRAPDIAWGRPVALAVAPDGALYVSDDQNGVIYRISSAETQSRAGGRSTAGSAAVVASEGHDRGT